METILISSKTIGQRGPLFADWSIPLPPELSDAGGVTLRTLITAMVRREVAEFLNRQAERKLFRALTTQQIATGVERGKVAMGGSEVGEQHVDSESAVAAALQAFEDGLYLVAIDGQEHRSLESQVFLKPASRVTFIRLTLLSGG